MDLEKLREAVPGVQEAAADNAAYNAGIEEVIPIRLELESHLGVVEQGIHAIYNDVASATSLGTSINNRSIVLENVNPKTEQDEAEAQDNQETGQVVVTIYPLRHGGSHDHISGTKWGDTEYRTVDPTAELKTSDYSAFGIVFVFVPANRQLNNVFMDAETTLSVDPTAKSSRPGIEHPPRIGDFTEQNVERLKNYREIYLPARRKQIEELEKTVALIKAALEDPELNPWVAELRRLEAEKQDEAERVERDLVAERIADSTFSGLPPKATRKHRLGRRQRA